jgi:hypothetical protein
MATALHQQQYMAVAVVYGCRRNGSTGLMDAAVGAADAALKLLQPMSQPALAPCLSITNCAVAITS